MTLVYPRSLAWNNPGQTPSPRVYIIRPIPRPFSLFSFVTFHHPPVTFHDDPFGIRMASSSDAVLTLTSTSICALLIIARCFYRFTVRCNIHSTCHRRWRIDDFYMTVAILPLIGRALCILYSFLLNPNHTYEPSTSDAVNAERELSHKLLIPARIFYALLYESQLIEGGRVYADFV